MAVQGGEDVYATLLLTDTYLPGALVLAHSLRDAGTTKKLAVLVTLDTVSAEVVAQLQSVYDYVLSVPRIRNERPANLQLMNRPDLHSAFTKINLWRQTQFRRIVYVDADVVAFRAPDELFDLPHAFAAAPDIGWPDLFNTGVMALTPDMGDYYALMAMAERGISFDGADQGLLNMYFKNGYHRLSFAYNVTPSAHYQYMPAYRHFQSTISLVHFIGTEKPWLQGRHATTGSSPYNEMIGRWWAVYDRHYRKENTEGSFHAAVPDLVQYFVKGEYQPRVSYVVPVGEPQRTGNEQHDQHHQPSTSGQQQEHHHRRPPPHHYQHHQDQQGEYHYQEQPQGGSYQSAAHQTPPSNAFRALEGSHTEAREEQAAKTDQAPPQQEHAPAPPQAPPAPSWDASRQPPPADSRPEALNFPHTRYEMSSDPAPFVPPQRYPSPPRGMWYDVPPKAPNTDQVTPAPPKPIFPWETHQPRASRVFADPDPPVLEHYMPAGLTSTSSSGERQSQQQQQQQQHGPPPAEHHSSTAETAPSSSETQQPEPDTPTTSTAPPLVPSDPWSSFTRTNAWDEVPQIERYVDSLQQKHRRVRSHGAAPVGLGHIRMPTPSFVFGQQQQHSGGGDGDEQPLQQRRGSKLTDFPSEVERPSLPVTPAPMRRPVFWGGGGGGGSSDTAAVGSHDFPHGGAGGNGDGDDEGQQLPAARGVPTQSDWDPVAQLQKLARQQSEALLQRLGSGVGGGGGIYSGAAGTEGEEGGRSGEGGHQEIPNRSLPFGSEDIRSPTYVAQSAPVLSPRPLKPETGSSSVQKILTGTEEATPRTMAGSTLAQTIPEPAYKGPGPMFEKGEEYPTEETPALPTEEEEDVLET